MLAGVAVVPAASPVEAQPLALHAAPDFNSNFKIVRPLLEQPESQMDLAGIKLAVDQMIDPTIDSAAVLTSNSTTWRLKSGR